MIVTSLTYSEASIIKLLTQFVWKRVPPMNSDFFAPFLFLWNLIVGLILGGLTTRFSKSGRKVELMLLGGNPELTIPPEFNLR